MCWPSTKKSAASGWYVSMLLMMVMRICSIISLLTIFSLVEASVM